MKIIGLDFETSGSDINDGAVPIQLGLAVINEDEPYSGFQVTSLLIGGWQWGKDATWSEEAEEVHRISKADLEGIEPARIIDIRLAHWLVRTARATGQRMWNIPVGWNVAGFDMPFVRKYLPTVGSLLSYRTVDLNALVFALSQGHVSEFKRIKAQVKVGAADYLSTMGIEGQWHDAGYDAAASLAAYHELTGLIHDGQ